MFVVGTDGGAYTCAWEPSARLAGLVAHRDRSVPAGREDQRRLAQPDHLDIFATDTAGRVLTAAWEPAFTDGWHGWWDLKGGRARPGAPVTGVSRSTNKLDVFVTGTDGGCYTAAWEPAFTDWWHGWWRIGDRDLPAGRLHRRRVAQRRQARHLRHRHGRARSSPRPGSRPSPTAGTAGGSSAAAGRSPAAP